MTKLLRWWWTLVERTGLRPGFATEVLDDLPDVLTARRIYMIGDESRPWAAALVCPCGCGATIQLSLIADDSPSWRAKRHFSGSVTLHPSIWRKRGCRSHFFLRRGRIVWSELPDAAASTSTPRPPSPASSMSQRGSSRPSPARPQAVRNRTAHDPLRTAPLKNQCSA